MALLILFHYSMRQLKLAVVECRPECHSLHKEDLCSNNNNPTVHRWAATNTNHTVNVKESVNASATTRPLLQQPHKLRLNVMTNKIFPWRKDTGIQSRRLNVKNTAMLVRQCPAAIRTRPT